MGHVRMGTTEDMSVGVMRDEKLKLRDLKIERICVFIYSRIKKVERQGGKKSH